MFATHPPETVAIGPAVIRWTDARHGDCGLDAPAGAHHALVSGGWVNVRQVHGTDVLVTEDGTGAGGEADAIVTANPDLTIAVQTADCAPIALVGKNKHAAVHAGWRGLRAGIVSRTVEAMGDEVVAALGPCIHQNCYEVSEELAADFERHWGSEVMNGRLFDLPRAVGIECERAGISLVYQSAHCTACSGMHYSHRKLRSSERQVMLVSRRTP